MQRIYNSFIGNPNYIVSNELLKLHLKVKSLFFDHLKRFCFINNQQIKSIGKKFSIYFYVFIIGVITFDDIDLGQTDLNSNQILQVVMIVEIKNGPVEIPIRIV